MERILVRYLGGALPLDTANHTMEPSADGVCIVRTGRLTVAWPKVLVLDVESEEELQRRDSVASLIASGRLSLQAKKPPKTPRSFVLLETTDGTSVFQLNEKDAAAVKAQLAGWPAGHTAPE